jgi:glucose/arabinose dehydrogenase
MFHLLYGLMACQMMSNQSTTRQRTTQQSTTQQSTSYQSTSQKGIELAQANEFPYRIEVVADRLNTPWALDIDSKGDIYFTERGGNIRLIEDGKLYDNALYTFQAPFISVGEGGLLGIALDPDFEENHFLYVMYTYEEARQIYTRVVRMVRTDHELRMDEVLIDKIRAGRTHSGGRIKIGPDGKLYITTGDAGIPDLAQDLTSLAGKILRINLDGSIPSDNPLLGSPIYSYGHRNPQGLAWDQNGVLYASEHGQSAHDEINIIIAGQNYGWPIVEGDETTNEYFVQLPILQSGNVTWAPSGMDFAEEGPWQGKLLVANLLAEQLLVVSLNELDNGIEVATAEPWLQKEFGRLREVVRANDGSIYLATSNRDGRGRPSATDDRILRLTLSQS